MSNLSNVQLIGQEQLQSKLSKLTNSRRVFDPVIQKESRQSLRRLISTTPRKTGNLSRSWQRPKKIDLSTYQNENPTATSGRKKRSVAVIQDKGRGAVFPVRSKFLYIPLTNKGASKPIGANILGRVSNHLVLI